MHYFITFFVSGWFSALHFLVRFLPHLRFTNLRRKSAAKVLLFYELTKFLGNFFWRSMHFLHKQLIINQHFFHIPIYTIKISHSGIENQHMNQTHIIYDAYTRMRAHTRVRVKGNVYRQTHQIKQPTKIYNYQGERRN